MFPILLGKNNNLEKRVKALEDSGGGGSSGGSILVITFTEGVLDKTWKEINDADFSILKHEFVAGALTFTPVIATISNPSENNYTVAFRSADMDNTVIFSTTTPNGYPVMEGG